MIVTCMKHVVDLRVPCVYISCGKNARSIYLSCEHHRVTKHFTVSSRFSLRIIAHLHFTWPSCRIFLLHEQSKWWLHCTLLHMRTSISCLTFVLWPALLLGSKVWIIEVGLYCLFCPPRVCQEAKKAEVISKINVVKTFEPFFNEIHTIHILRTP